MAYLLVWLDLLQLAYCVTAYVCFAGIATLLGRQGAISPRAATGIARAAIGAALVVVLGVAFSMLLPRGAELVPAWAAFVFSIPFMTTLVPFVLGLTMLAARASAPGAIARPTTTASAGVDWRTSSRPRG